MSLDEHHAAGLLLLLTSLICLGTWPALLRSCEPCGHRDDTNYDGLRCCVYMDYAAAYVVVSAVPLLFYVYQHSSPEDPSDSLGVERIVTACGGGVFLSLGNMCLQWAVSEAPLTTVLALQSSLTVVLGTSLNYLLEPHQTPRPTLLLVGVLVFMVAISFASAAQYQYSQKATPSSTLHDSSLEIEMEAPYGTTMAASTHTNTRKDGFVPLSKHESDATASTLQTQDALTVDTTAVSINQRKRPLV